MSTFRSHFRAVPPKDSSAPERERSRISRIPAKPSSSNVDTKQSNATQHVSRLARRSSASVKPEAKSEAGSKSRTNATPAPTSYGRNAGAASASATPIPEAQPPSNTTPLIPRLSNVLMPRPTIRTPSLVSGTTASTLDSRKSIRLRRKPSTIEQYAASKRAETPRIEEVRSAAGSSNNQSKAGFEDSVLGIALPPSQHTSQAGEAVTRDPTPPVPSYAQTSTPSTRYTDSPFSHVPTPSSASSYSPAMLSTTSTKATQLRQSSPTRSRPSVPSRTNVKSDSTQLSLPPVREASTSSSNSTVKLTGPRGGHCKDNAQGSASLPPQGTSQASSRGLSHGQRATETSRSSSKPSSVKLPAKIPPELAHLDVEPTQNTSLNRSIAPPRPSRDGTPTLTGMNAASPVVHSDLPRLYTTYHKRTPSQETPTSATSPTFKARFGLSPKTSSKHSSPRIDSAISPPPAARAFTRGRTSDESTSHGPRLLRKDSPAVAPSPSKAPRFGLFSRKPKSDTTKPVEKPKRQPSKGPTAGTGHEGYGRFGVRSRSGSSISSSGVRSPSAESNTSGRGRRQSTSKKSSTDGYDMDDFLRERLSPVILRGSGSTFGNTASSSEAQAPSMPNSSKKSSFDSFQKPQLLPSAMESANAATTIERPAQSRRAVSDSSEDDVNARYRQFDRYQSAAQLQQPVRIDARTPRTFDRPSKDSSFDSYDSEHAPWAQTGSTYFKQGPMEGKEGLWLRSGTAPPPQKSERKWNFFQRAHASPRAKGKTQDLGSADNSNSIAHESPYRSIAHYAVQDATEPLGLDDVERIVRDNETSAEESAYESNAPSKVASFESRRTSLLPSPIKSDHSSDFDFKADSQLPRIMIRPGSEESPELMRAEKAVPHQAPHVVDIRRSPIAQQTEPWGEQNPTVSGLKPEENDTGTIYETPDIIQAPFNTPEDPESNSPARQPRLSPIGRIPKVVSKRDRDRKLSDNSFSRPFVYNQPKPTVKPPGSLYTQIRELASPIESGSQPVSSTSANSNRVSVEHYRFSPELYDRAMDSKRDYLDEFLTFPHRKDSEISHSSSSGDNSILAILSAQRPQEDDYWNEYDDLIDDVMPRKTLHRSTYWTAPLSNSASTAFVKDGSDVIQTIWQPPQSKLPTPPKSVPADLGKRTGAPAQSISHADLQSAPPTPASVPGSVHKRTTASGRQLVSPSDSRPAILQTSGTSIPGPNVSSRSATDRTSIPGPPRSSLPRSSRSSLPPPNPSGLPRSNRSSAQGSITSSTRQSRNSGHSRSASLPEANARNSQTSLTPSARFNRDTQLLNIEEVDGDEQAAAANLRFGALMTSKWLSFGRVLFSPAHNEMRLAAEPRVLIVDGSGSDWSYYVALSYPAATVYYLGTESANGMSDWPGVNQKPPSNHRNITHAAISAAFPFPKGFFTAVVFRYPVATTDSAYQACIFECKRVLRPGGYLEIAALDLDLMNMGNKARKEVRGLKTRMQLYDTNVSLRNLSDCLVRQLGRRGFEDVQRCIVGVPAAGRIPRSQDISSVSSHGSGKPVWHREDRQSQEFSFADLLEDARASEAGENTGSDENITKMVAKVGRWWYTTCYEQALLMTDSSIWNDSTLLRECEKQGTSFRLLICYAQKPPQTRRRTVSV